MTETLDPEDLVTADTSDAPLRPRAGSRSIAPGASFDLYVILDTLGRGGAGRVYAAYDPKLDRKVALKLLRDRSEEQRQRLLREAQAMARLAHVNVVAVFDTGVVEGQSFIAMEFVRGTTLRAWQKERPWPDTLRAYLEAGKGLAAAHDAALVHRDFKPDNVLVSEAGEIKVTDFGIVHPLRGGEASSPSPEGASGGALPSGSTPASRMTEDGAIVGTPGYMAPEQFCAETIDARTDQFAFCVSLFEALYGEKPFAAHSRSLVDVMNATLKGELRPPPKGTKVPPYLHAVLARGLRAEQSERYPSMGALLDALRRDPARARRRWALVAGATAIAATGAVLAVRAAAARDAREQRLCAGAEGEVAETWNDDVKGRVEAALLATGAPYAADTSRRVREELDHLMSAWAAMHRQTCEATRIQQTQSEAVMTARMACLERRRERVGALVRVLVGADPDTVSRALPAVRELPSLDECKDIESLTAIDREPTDAAAVAELAAIRGALADVEMAVDLERFSAAKTQVAPLVTRARAAGYRPLLAQVMLASSRARAVDVASRGWLDDGIEAVTNADESRADRLRAEAATWITLALSKIGRLDEAEQWSRFADAALHRAGDPPLERASWFNTLDNLRYDQGRHRDAVAAERQAFELARRAALPETVLAEYERVLAQSEAAIGDTKVAEDRVEDADRAAVRAFGADHPRRIRFLGAASYVFSLANDTQRGIDYARQAAALGERVAPESVYLGTTYSNACWLLYGTGDLAAAMAYCEKAVAAVLRNEGPSAMGLAYAYRDRADVLRGMHRYAEADADYERALAIHERGGTKIPNYVYALGGLGQSRLAAGRRAEAVTLLERAIAAGAAIDMQTKESEAILADIEFALARALVETGKAGKGDARAEELAREAAAAFTDANRDESARQVASWLAARRSR